jgi:hypothetical protein
MNRLLLASGLAMTKQAIFEVVHRTMLMIVAYAVLMICGLVAGGFLTAAGFLYLAQTRGATETCMIIAGIYALIAVFGFLVMLLIEARRRKAAVTASIIPSEVVAAASASPGSSGGIASLGLVAVVGYLLAKAMTRKT